MKPTFEIGFWFEKKNSLSLCYRRDEFTSEFYEREKKDLKTLTLVRPYF